jgi:hypothetical protein
MGYQGCGPGLHEATTAMNAHTHTSSMRSAGSGSPCLLCPLADPNFGLPSAILLFNFFFGRYRRTPVYRFSRGTLLGLWHLLNSSSIHTIFGTRRTSPYGRCKRQEPRYPLPGARRGLVDWTREAGYKAQQCFEDLMQDYTHQWPRRPEINFIMCLHEWYMSVRKVQPGLSFSKRGSCRRSQ